MPTAGDVAQLLAIALFAGSSWLWGRYFQARGVRSDSVFVSAPAWLRRLCGSPRRDGRLDPARAYAQLMSLVMVVLGLFARFLPLGPNPVGVVSIVTMLMLFVGTGALLTWQDIVGRRRGGPR